MNRNYNTFDWSNKILVLSYIINGLEKIHQSQMIHCDLNTKNILFGHNGTYISGMSLCREIDNVSETKIYGILPYVAPEVLNKKPYTKAADIYSFGMIMYFVATGRQPFDNHPHDTLLILNICNGIRPELNDPEAPECYINLMKKCWDPNPENRPNAFEIKETIMLFYYSYVNFIKKGKGYDNYEIERQFKKAEEHRKTEECKKAKEHKFESKSTTKATEKEGKINKRFDQCII
jgi:serine/threonine protein kinase